MRNMRVTNRAGTNGPALAIDRRGFARVQFADWLHENHPALYGKAMAYAAGGNSSRSLAGMGLTAPAEPTKSFWQKFTEGATALGTTFLSLKNQRDAMQINLTRAQQGLPPIDAATSAPVVRTQVDMDPALAQRLMSTAGEGLNRTIMMVAGLGLVAILLLSKKK